MLGGESTIVWHSDTSLSVHGVPFDLQHETDPVPGRLLLYKSREMIEAYEPIIREFQHANIFELGIFGGGSTAFFAQTCRPRTLVAIELSVEPVVTLERSLAEHGLDDSVRLHYGVDQANRERLRAIVDQDVAGEALDLVIDDASHIYGPTRASFEALFPLVRPGGLYIIEDWRSQDWFIRMFSGLIGQPRGDALAAIEASLAIALAEPVGLEGPVFAHWFVRTVRDPTAPHHAAVVQWFDTLPDTSSASALGAHLRRALGAEQNGAGPPTMGTLAAELCMGMKSGHPGLAEVTITPHWIAARRGTTELDPDRFTLDELAADPFAILSRHDPVP